jgi:citrate synthase
MKRPPEEILEEASRWWDTSIIDVRPGSIAIRGYPIGELIGRIGFPSMIWLMLRGELPSPQQASLLEAAMVASVDHGPHAPSIAIARMAATCGVGLNGAMASAINVLDDIHGGAGQQCMEMLDAISEAARGRTGVPTAALAAVRARLENDDGVVPGFGHRFHPVDPRVAPIIELLESARDAGVVTGRYVAIGKAIGQALAQLKGRAIPMNIDGVTAVAFRELGFVPEVGRGLFVLSRAVGILAHAWEQKQAGRRIMGPMPKEIPYHYSGPRTRTLASRELP